MGNTSREKTKYLMSYWDTEDYISPPDSGMDDAILLFARGARDARMKACFHIMGEKVRTLLGRERTDVINELKNHHDVSLHYNFGSIHPTTPQLMTDAGWDEGVQIALSRERPGFRLLEETFGRCTGLTRHGTSYAPQIIHICGLEGKVYWRPLFKIPESPIFWYCNTLCLDTSVLYVMDDVYNDSKKFEPAFQQMKEGLSLHLDDPAVKIVCFAGHPHKAFTEPEEYADINHFYGRNCLWESLRPPRQIPHEKFSTVERNVKRTFDFIANAEGYTKVTLETLAERFNGQKFYFNSDELLNFAERVLEEKAPCYTDVMSAGEGILALSDALVWQRGAGKLPGRILRRETMGPTSIPREEPQPSNLTGDQITDLGRRILDAARTTGHLPAAVITSGGEIGLGSALLALSELYCLSKKRSGRIHTTIAAKRSSPWPLIAETMTAEIKSMPKWVVFSSDMDVSRIILFSRLMSWTLKPATEKE
jgi:hypothetical protein